MDIDMWQIGDDDESITRACDFCFNTSYKTPDGFQISTTVRWRANARQPATETSTPQNSSASQAGNFPWVDEGLKTCEGCGMVYYCDKVCSDECHETFFFNMQGHTVVF